MSENDQNDNPVEEPEGPPGLGLLYQQFLAQLQRFGTSENVQAASDYVRGMEDWNRNLPRFGYDEDKMEGSLGRERPEPALAIRYVAGPSFTIIIVQGPGFVSELIPLVEAAAPPPAGVVEFGHPVPGWHREAYWTGRSTVPAGHVAEKDGKQFQMIELGQLGTLFYRRIWELRF